MNSMAAVEETTTWMGEAGEVSDSRRFGELGMSRAAPKIPLRLG